MSAKDGGVWLAFKPCGCLVGVCKGGGVAAEDAAKLEWLTDGLTVRSATWQEWQDLLPVFLADCPHGAPEAQP